MELLFSKVKGKILHCQKLSHAFIIQKNLFYNLEEIPFKPVLSRMQRF